MSLMKILSTKKATNNDIPTLHINLLIRYDSEGKIFDITLHDGVHSISIKSFDLIEAVVKKMEEIHYVLCSHFEK